MMKKFLWFLTAALLIYACQGKQPQQETLFREVIEVHDAVMPRMGELMQLQQTLIERIEKLQQDSTQNQDSIAHLTALKEDVQQADRSMMEWMRAFDSEMEGMSQDEKITYLQQEQKKVESLRDEINTAISHAQEAVQ